MEQLELVERYLIRIRQMYRGNNSLEWDERHYNKDDVYSFFVHCNHLRDWVLKLNKVGIDKSDIIEFIHANKPIQICADLANRAKHCRLKEQTWSGCRPHLSGTTHKSSRTYSEYGVQSKFTVVANNEIFDVLELAEQCWLLWDGFISKYKNNCT